jgi:hypothetical protein
LIDTSTKRLHRVPDRLERALLDTSVVIDLDRIPADTLPLQVAVSAVTMAELAAGTAAASDEAERARRQDRLQRAEATFDPLPLDTEAARAYGRIYASVRAQGRNPGRRLADLLIAAIALANALPVVTRNAADFAGLEDLIDVFEV